MDRTGIIVVTACVILLGFWFVAEQKYSSQRLQQQTATNVVAIPQREAKISTTTFPTPGTSPGFSFDTNAPEELIAITNAHARYTFTSRGGGLKSVELLDFPETVSPRWKKGAAANGVATLNTHAAVPVLTILGESNLVGDGNFTLKTNDGGVRMEKSFVNGLRIVKEFHVGSNYLVDATVRLENTSGKSISLPAQEWVVGTATPMGPDDNGLNEGVMWFDGAKAQNSNLGYFSTNTTFLFFFSRTPKTEYLAGMNNVVWACGAQPVFRADGNADHESAGTANCRSSGHFATIFKRRADGKCAIAAGNSNGAGLSGADPRNEPDHRAANCSLRGAKGISDAGADW